MEQLFAWGVLLVVLAVIASGRFRIETTALVGLLILGLAGTAPPGIIFSGFGHPALAAIVAVFIISQGIINTELLRGLGQSLGKRVRSLRGQIISIAAAGSIMSAFMNNVGAIGIILPTAVRMAKRSKVIPGSFGLPLAVASILGGTLTIIGSAPNIIVATYLFSITGQSFKMFDFTPHGLAMLATALLIWVFCRSCGMEPGAGGASDSKDQKGNDFDSNETIQFAPLATRKRQLTLASILFAVLTVSFGVFHPALGFGAAALFLVITGILRLSDVYNSIDLKIVFFIGAMLGIGQTLEHTGSLDLLSTFLTGFTEGISPFWLIILLVFVSSGLSNAINNAAAAVFMAPLAASIAASGSLELTAGLMAVAAGSSMTLLLPTHQAVLMVASRAPFSTVSFVKSGLVLSPFCGIAASLVINFVWQ